MKKRLLAMLLCVIMVLALLPATAFAEDNKATSVWIWGVELTGEESYYLNGDKGAKGSNSDEKNFNARFDAATGTLTLNGLNVMNSTATMTDTNTFTYAIYANGDLRIIMDGNASVSTADDEAPGNVNIALGVKGNLTFTGSAKLTATAGTGKSAVGVYILGDLEVSSGTLEGCAVTAGGTATRDAESFGVCAMGDIKVSGGRLTGSSSGVTAKDKSISAGIRAGDVTVSGDGVINATGSTSTAAEALSYGLQVESLDIKGGTVTATVEGTATGSKSCYNAGVAARNGLSVSGGSLTATGDGAAATDGAYAQSCGIYTEAESVSFSGGTVVATGGTGDGGNSYGIYTTGAVDVSDGTVTAKGGSINTDGYYFSAGLCAKGMTFSGGTVTATGAAVTGDGYRGSSFGIGCSSGGAITVKNSAIIEAVGDVAPEQSYGIYGLGDNTITVSGGTLTAYTKKTTGTSFAALSVPLTFEAGSGANGSTSSNGSDAVDYDGANYGDYKWVQTKEVPALKVTASQSGSVAVGTEVTLKATPINIEGTPNYQWYSNTDNDTTTGIYIVGQTDSDLAWLTNTAGTIYYYCVASIADYGDVTSNIVGVTVSQPSGGDYTPSPVTVYNDPSQPDATVWLKGTGLDSSDLLVTERDPRGSEYDALMKLADGDDVFSTYNIYLRSGKKSTGSAMNLTFDLNTRYASQDFTLVHQKADSTYEYFYDTADVSGDLTFGPLYELSPFMLVKGTLTKTAYVNLDDVPKTGDNAQPGLWAGIVLISLFGLGAVAYSIKRKHA